MLELPSSSAGKESACEAGDPSLIPGSGRSAGEGIGCPLQFFLASLVTQLVKNLPVIQETWVGSLLCWEDPLEKGVVPLSHIIFTILTIFKCISVALNAFTLSCNHYQHPSPQLFYHFNWNEKWEWKPTRLLFCFWCGGGEGRWTRQQCQGLLSETPYPLNSTPFPPGNHHCTWSLWIWLF